MGQVITVVSGKGGTGKTSVTANIGMALAQMGHPTLCLDCDVGLRNLDIALAMTDRAVMDFTDVMYGRCSLEEAAVRHPGEKNLYLLTAPARSGADEISREGFRGLFPEIKERFHYCLVDAPAGLGRGFQLALAGADRAVELHIIALDPDDGTGVYTVTIPKRADATDEQARNRIMPNVEWEAQLEGAVHGVKVRGTLRVTLNG